MLSKIISKYYKEFKSVDGRLRQKGFSDLGSEKMALMISELIGRWKRCKAEITRGAEVFDIQTLTQSRFYIWFIGVVFLSISVMKITKYARARICTEQ